VVEFVSDAPKLAITRWNANNVKALVYVDGYLIEENPTAHVSGNPSFFIIDWGTARRPRTYRIENAGVDNFRGLAMDTASSVWPVPVTGDVGVLLGDSFNGTISTYSQQTYEYMSEQFAKALGVRYLKNLHMGSTGYVTGGASNYYNGYTVLTNNPSIADASVSKVIFCYGYNDTSATVAQTQTNALLAWQTARTMFPNAVIGVFGPWSGRSGPSAAILAIDAGLKSTFTAWADPASFFASIANDGSGSWTSGTGCWGATTGTGNSDIYTGTDATPPTALGKTYLVNRLAQVADAAFASLGA
jgi:hypothetical protein